MKRDSTAQMPLLIISGEIQTQESVVKTVGAGGPPAQDRFHPALEDLDTEGQRSC